MKTATGLLAITLLTACASAGTPSSRDERRPPATTMSQERSVLELQRAALERLLTGVEPYLADIRVKELCVVPATMTSVRGRRQWAGDPRDRKSRSSANWLIARVHPPGRNLVASLDCQFHDDGWRVRDTGAPAVSINVGGLVFGTQTDAVVHMGAERSRNEFMTFSCPAKRRGDTWTLGDCLCEDQKGAAAVCLII